VILYSVQCYAMCIGQTIIRFIIDRGSPVKMLVKSLSQVRQVSAGSNHTVLLTADGHVLTCGSNQVCCRIVVLT